MHTAKLDEIVRQKDPALKSAVELLATGQVSAALDALQQQGQVREIPNREERVRAIAKIYIESPENTLIVSPDNASRCLWLANCYFAHNSLEFPVLLGFCDVRSGRPFHPFHRYPGSLARTWRCPFHRC